MKTSNYNIRLDPVIKAQAEETFAEFGLKLSDAINVFLHMAVIRHGFPFEIANPKLRVETMQAIQETEEIIKQYENGTRTGKTYTNAREFLQDILDEEDGDEI
jgi:DNA-damage-inducible protein J